MAEPQNIVPVAAGPPAQVVLPPHELVQPVAREAEEAAHPERVAEGGAAPRIAARGPPRTARMALTFTEGLRGSAGRSRG